jgi:glucose/arabinose dehydrogenase
MKPIQCERREELPEMEPRRISSFRSVAAFLIFLIAAAACNSSAISADIPIELEGKRPVGYEIFAEGWLQNNKAWGRPVDIIIMKDGSLLVSDDRAGAIYRITYSE